MIEQWIKRTKMIKRLKARDDDLSQNAAFALEALMSKVEGMEMMMDSFKDMLETIHEQIQRRQREEAQKDEKTRH